MFGLNKNKNKKCSCMFNECADTVPASCVPVEIDFPQWSSLYGNECVGLEDVLKDLYAKIDEITESIDLKDLGDRCKSCIDYGVDSKDELTVNRVLFALERKICEG